MASSRTALAVFAASIAACAPGTSPDALNVVEIIGTDYAFAAPATLPAGRVTFEFANRGKMRHELNISRLKPGVSVDDFLKVVRAGESTRALIEGPVGVLFADPGGRSGAGLSVDLEAGQRYAVICIFRDSPGVKRHYDLGMYTVISVGSTPASPAQQAATDTIVATDYAFQYPRNVRPGRRTLHLRNSGKQRHQMSLRLLKQGVTLDSVAKVDDAGGDSDALFEGSFGLLHSRGGESALGGLTLSMLPARDYVILCFFQDTDTAPEHVDLGMYGVIHTSSDTLNQSP